MIFKPSMRALAAKTVAVPRSYIVCAKDKAIVPALQRVMAIRAGCVRIKELPACYSPFLSDPAATVEVFHRLVTEQ